MNGRILAVSYLLGIAADSNLKDRWGNTVLDIALQGESSYHMCLIFHVHANLCVCVNLPIAQVVCSPNLQYGRQSEHPCSD